MINKGLNHSKDIKEKLFDIFDEEVKSEIEKIEIKK